MAVAAEMPAHNRGSSGADEGSERRLVLRGVRQLGRGLNDTVVMSLHKGLQWGITVHP